MGVGGGVDMFMRLFSCGMLAFIILCGGLVLFPQFGGVGEVFMCMFEGLARSRNEEAEEFVAASFRGFCCLE